MFIESGGIEVARTEERMQELHAPRRLGELVGDRAGLDAHAAEVKELVPFINEQLIVGGFYTPGAGVVDSLRAGDDHARARAARPGMTVSANTEVLGIDVEGGRVTPRAHHQAATSRPTAS